MTNGVLNTVESWTGHRPESCPWNAFRDPLVGRVIEASNAAELGVFDRAYPRPSHRLLDGLAHYEMSKSRIRFYQLKQEEADRKRRGGHG